MQKLSEQRAAYGFRRKMAVFFIFSVIFFCVPAKLCYAAEPAPEAEPEIMEGEGMLSPSSESSEGSVFGKAASEEPVTDEKLETLLSQIQDRKSVV